MARGRKTPRPQAVLLVNPDWLQELANELPHTSADAWKAAYEEYKIELRNL
jgi:hypothetical protein